MFQETMISLRAFIVASY